MDVPVHAAEQLINTPQEDPRNLNSRDLMQG